MSKKRVLVIEDSRDAAEALAMMLRAAGHEVATAASGAEGLDAARAFNPGVVVCDVRLPGALDGLRVARALKSDPSLGGILLVALSGVADPGQRSIALSAGFDHYLIKPAPPDEILRLVADARGRE